MYFIYWSLQTLYGEYMCLNSPMILTSQPDTNVPCACKDDCLYLSTHGIHIKQIQKVDIPKVNINIHMLKQRIIPRSVSWPYTLYIQISCKPYSRISKCNLEYQWSFTPLQNSDINYVECLNPEQIHYPRAWKLDI